MTCCWRRMRLWPRRARVFIIASTSMRSRAWFAVWRKAWWWAALNASARLSSSSAYRESVESTVWRLAACSSRSTSPALAAWETAATVFGSVSYAAVRVASRTPSTRRLIRRASIAAEMIEVSASTSTSAKVVRSVREEASRISFTSSCMKSRTASCVVSSEATIAPCATENSAGVMVGMLPRR